MYLIDRARLLVRSRRSGPQLGQGAPHSGAATKARAIAAVSKVVWALGVTSFLTDISSEMVASVLPAYLVLHLGMTPFTFGVVDGIYQGATAIVRVAGGFFADRWHKHTLVAGIGYAMSAVSRILMIPAGSVAAAIGAVIAMDRIGKGVRTAPRDALISLHTQEEHLATAFGVHRALDAAGAMFGPLLAFLLLTMLPGGFSVLFVASFGIAIMGVGAIALLVPRVVLRPPDPLVPSVSVSLRTTMRLLADPTFRALVLAGAILGLPAISDSFVFLILQQRLKFGASTFPLLYFGTFLVASLLAFPCGRLADRVGRKQMLLAGYGTLAVGYLGLLLPASNLALLPVAVALGIFYAATDGVLMAMAAAILPASHLGGGLALLATVTSLARLLASGVFGLLWSRIGIDRATAYYVTALVLAITGAWMLLRKTPRHAS